VIVTVVPIFFFDSIKIGSFIPKKNSSRFLIFSIPIPVEVLETKDFFVISSNTLGSIPLPLSII